MGYLVVFCWNRRSRYFSLLSCVLNCGTRSPCWEKSKTRPEVDFISSLEEEERRFSRWRMWDSAGVRREERRVGRWGVGFERRWSLCLCWKASSFWGLTFMVPFVNLKEN